MAARFAFNALLRGPAARLAARRGDTPHHRDGTKLLEELWVLLGNSAMLGAALFVVLHRCAALRCSAGLRGTPGVAPAGGAAAQRWLQQAGRWPSAALP